MISDDLMNRVLEKINKTTAAYNHFFNEINNPAWLALLKEKGYFLNPPPAIRENGYIQFPSWSESEYLVRVADSAQDEVLEIIKVLPETDNERVMNDVVQALLKIDTAKSVRLTEAVKKYVSKSQYLLLHQTASEFVCKLANDGRYRPALGLARVMLEVLPDPEKAEKLKSDYIMLKPSTKYRDHEYKDIVDKITPSLAKASPLDSIDMYAALLQKAIDYELSYFKNHDEEVLIEEKQDDLSNIWRPNIAEDSEYDHGLEHVLATALRDSVKALVHSDTVSDVDKLTKLEVLASNKYSIFKRVVEFGLRDHKDNNVFHAFYNSLVKDEQLKQILKGEKSGVGVVKTGFVTEKPTAILKDLPDDELIKILKSYKDESGWSFERESVPKELAELVQRSPKRFAPLIKHIASAKNEYLDEAVRAFHSIVDSLDDEDVVTILASLVAVYKAGNVVREGERHDYYEWSKSSTIRLIEKLLSQKEDKTERVSDKSLAAITELLLLLCREIKPTVQDNPNLEPAELSINSPRGQAIHALAYLLAWMNRNKVDKALYTAIFDELDWHLVPENDAELAIRSAYGWRFELLYGTDREWALKNINNIFSDDKLGEAAFDAYVMFNGVHPEALKILSEVFLKQLSRLATPPADTGKGRHDGLKNFAQHLALHYWYGDLDLSNDSMMSILLRTADKRYIKELVNFIGFRLYRGNDDEVKESQICKLIELWEAVVKSIEDDDTKVEVLEEFGTWFASGKFDPKWSLDRLTYAALNTGGIHLDFAVLKYMEAITEQYPTESLKALSAMVDNAKERWAVSSWSDSATKIIQTAYSSSDETVKLSATALANKLVAKGYPNYRKIIS